MTTARCSSLRSIDPLYKWRLNLNNITHTSVASHSSENSFVLKHESEVKDVDADCVKPDGQNSVISFISKWLLPQLSFPTAGQGERGSGNEITSVANECAGVQLSLVTLVAWKRFP